MTFLDVRSPTGLVSQPMVDYKRAVMTLMGLAALGGFLGVGLMRGGFFGKTAPAPTVDLSVPAAPPAPALPALEESDVLVRSKAMKLSSSPRFLEWLNVDDLLRRAAAAADLIGRGQIPKDALGFLAPRGKYAAVKKGGKLYPDPKSYARYDLLAGTVASIDASAAGALFAEFEPLFQAACRDFGHQDCDVKKSFGRAFRELLDTPPLETAPELVPTKNRMLHAYADPKLEALSPAQKQLLRMGPVNAEKIRGKLRELATAASLPL